MAVLLWSTSHSFAWGGDDEADGRTDRGRGVTVRRAYPGDAIGMLVERTPRERHSPRDISLHRSKSDIKPAIHDHEVRDAPHGKGRGEDARHGRAVVRAGPL